MPQRFKYMYYYSYKLGNWKKNVENWALFDIKQPAPNPKSAIVILLLQFNLRHYLDGRKYGYWRDGIIHLPVREQVDGMVQQLIEYRRLRTPEYGYTQHRFKKQRVINRHEFLEWFPKELPDWNHKY